MGIVAERRPDTANLVGCHLLALTATTQNDSPIGITASHNLTDRDTERRVIGRFRRVRAKIGNLKSPAGKFVCQEYLHFISGVIRSDRNTLHRNSSLSSQHLATVG